MFFGFNGGPLVLECLPCDLLSFHFQNFIFNEYRIESAHANVIHVEIVLDSLIQALRSAAQGGADCEMKLAKNDESAFLAFTIMSSVILWKLKPHLK
jgi:hypothetical protein